MTTTTGTTAASDAANAAHSTAGGTGTADLLSSLQGEWEGTSRTWFEPDKLADESPVRGRIRRIGDSTFLLHEYEGTFDGEAREGVEILGLDHDEAGAFLSAWVDSFHMSRDVMVSRGGAAGGGFSVLGSYLANPAEPTSERWGWRTQVELRDANTLVLTAHNVQPGEAEQKATETVYTRKR